MKEVEKDRLLYETSGGGVTLSGGEPTAQPFFTLKLLEALKEKGYHTVLDTCGQVEWTTLEEFLSKVDLVLYDLKHMDPTIHRKLTGVSNELILSNLMKLTQIGYMTILVRVPIIPGYNDSSDNIKAIGGFLSSVGNIEAVELLPYHQLGIPKYEALGRKYTLPHLQPPKTEHLEELRGLLEETGLKVILEGAN